MKRTRMLAAVLCVAVVVVAAALVWHRHTAQPVLDPLLAETLSVSDQEQKSLSNAVQTIDQTDSADGLCLFLVVCQKSGKLRQIYWYG